MLESVIIILHLVVALAVIVLVLVQHGKGADMGASFGSGASNTVFGSQGSANFLSRTTAALVAIFFVTSVGLTYYARLKADPSLFDKTAPVATQPAKPVQQPTTDQTTTTVIDHTPAPANNQATTSAEQNAPAKQTQTNTTTTPPVNHQPAKPATEGNGQQK